MVDKGKVLTFKSFAEKAVRKMEERKNIILVIWMRR